MSSDLQFGMLQMANNMDLRRTACESIAEGCATQARPGVFLSLSPAEDAPLQSTDISTSLVPFV